MGIKIVGIGGSTANTCSSSWALKNTLACLEQLGASTQSFLIRDIDLPLYAHDPVGEPPADAVRLAKAVREADALVWSSPLYHGTVSGAFKNVIDWLQLTADNNPPYLTGKVVGLICAAGGTQGLQAINTMEYMVRSLRGWTVPLVAPISRASKVFDVEGKMLDPAAESLLAQLATEVLKGAEAMKNHS